MGVQIEGGGVCVEVSAIYDNSYRACFVVATYSNACLLMHAVFEVVYQGSNL